MADGLTRKPPWLGYNVFHTLHPQSLLMAASDIAGNENVAAARRLQAPHRARVDALRQFLPELHLPA